MNRVFLIGRLGKDVETRSTTNGMMATLNLATEERWKDKETGEPKKATNWFQVVTYSAPLAEMLERLGKKGRLVRVEATLRPTKYEKDGQTHYVTDIVVDPRGVVEFLDKPKGDDDEGEAQA